MSDQTITSLIEKLEGAEVGSRELDGEIWYALHEPDVDYGALHIEQTEQGPIEVLTCELGSKYADCVDKYTTNLDAAMTLAERVFSGCCVLVGDYKGLANHTRWNGKGEVRATKGWCSLSPDDEAASNYRVHAHTPSLALCAAILRAQSARV